jgi:hypothetical protein
MSAGTFAVYAAFIFGNNFYVFFGLFFDQNQLFSGQTEDNVS